MKHIRLSHCAVSIAVLCLCGALGAFADDDLDLKDEDKAITTFSGIANIVNTGSEARTLTLNLAANETFAGVISGDIRVVMAGDAHTRWVTLSADNTYTGGTEIRMGHLKGTSDTPFGATTGEIFVNTDLTDGRAVNSDTSTAVIFAKAGTSASAPQVYAYPIRCAEWTKHGQRPDSLNGSFSGSGTLYNIGLGEDYIKLTGAITGGDISIRCGTLDGTKWGSNPNPKSGPSVSGAVTASGGTLALSSRGSTFAMSGIVKVGAVYQPTYSDYPTPATYTNSKNEIGYYDCGRQNSGGGVTASANGAMTGAILISTTATFTKQTDGKSVSQNFDFGTTDQTINYPTIDCERYKRKPADSVGMYAHRIKFMTLKMQATLADGRTAVTNDWLFESDSAAPSVVWDPQGDYTLYNVSRAHTFGNKTSSGCATIEVKRGIFAMDTNCTFRYVQTINVAAGATFRCESTNGTALAGVSAITLGAGAKFYVLKSALTDGAIALTLASDAEFVFLDEDEVEEANFASVTLDGSPLPQGSYAKSAAGWTRPLPSAFKNVAQIVCASGTAQIQSVTWDAGGGDDTALVTAANWADDTTPAFGYARVQATFATAGTRATATGRTYLDKIIFGAPGDFALDASGEGAVRLSGGILAEAAGSVRRNYTLAAPVVVEGDQSWQFETNAEVTVASAVTGGEGDTVSLTSYQPVWLKGDGASDFRGTLEIPHRYVGSASDKRVYEPCVFATGVNPFGGEHATFVMAGGRQSGTTVNASALKMLLPQSTSVNTYDYTLFLSNATVNASVAFPYSNSEDRYGTFLHALKGTTNVINGAVANPRVIGVYEKSVLTFNGPVEIHQNDIGTDSSLCFRFWDHYKESVYAEDLKLSRVIFNGRVNFPNGTKANGNMNTMFYSEYVFNAPSNVIASVGGNPYFSIRTGADFAFANGATEIYFRDNGPSPLYLDGHSQHIGSIRRSYYATTSGNCSWIRSGAPAELRINQTVDHTYLGYIEATVTIVKEGSATLGLSAANAVRGAVTLKEGALAPALGSLASTVELTFAGGTLTLPEGQTTVSKAYYRDANGVIQPLPRKGPGANGTYAAGDGSAIGSCLTGSGTLKVTKSDFKYGMILVIQ